ncbi:hypothetical protein K461DRAFT_296927 [Myriangium duriaei CBS 260.36]|uniref:Uncharacterized protein n=1 Tax=Myriangium duriaei CBS 260.36 TaxID=1168546 RepID=A0A9P4ITM5_9PEZI|nr:hypothetical protein K461DRAFT_296927 [Myriangium duriaei CBS 260.36]
MVTRDDIRAIITPAVLDSLFSIRFPCEPDQTPEWRSLSGSPSDANLRRLALPLLQQLSAFGPDPNIFPDLLTVLGSPDQGLFPRHAVALIFLLDQCPRYYYSEGTDARWVSAFFDPLVQRLLDHLLAQPAELQLLGHERWEGFSYSNFLYISSLILTAADHSEDVRRHLDLHDISQERRKEIHAATGIANPFASLIATEGEDPLTFSRWMRAGLPPVADIYEWAYLRLAIVDVHRPVLERFGRYPWRNGSLGRLNSLEEEQFLEESGHFGEVDGETARLIRSDVAEGQWTRLSLLAP